MLFVVRVLAFLVIGLISTGVWVFIAKATGMME